MSKEIENSGWKFSDSPPLTEDQQRIFDLIESTDDNVLIVGKPGVGKSVLINALRTLGSKRYTLGAPTGLAATNIHGKTLHSLFMIPVSQGIFTPDFNRFTNNPNVLNNILHTIKHLIIDEISMVRADMLDYVDRLLRHVKGVDLPFGGIQVIAVGDFFQLPPIINAADRKDLLSYGYKSEFAFDARCFANFKTVQLTEVLRQKGDNSFIDILHAARTGKLALTHLQLLNKRVTPADGPRIRLTSRNKDAELVNQRELAAIREPAVEFHATSFGTWPEFPVDTVLTLKVGAQVLVKKNGADRPPRKIEAGFQSQVVNGSLGIIVGISEATQGDMEIAQAEVIHVELRNGSIVKVYRQRWELKEKYMENGEHLERVIATFEQIPLQLAWAISMHKSQGQSFEMVHVDPSSIFAAGQLYVALSRARSLAGMSLERPVRSTNCWANKRVLEFTRDIEDAMSPSSNAKREKTAPKVPTKKVKRAA